MAHGWMVTRCEEEHASGHHQDIGQAVHRRVDVDTKRGQNIGAAGPRGQRAVAVLGHGHTAAGDDEGHGRGHVQGPGAIAAGAANVDGTLRCLNRGHAGTHGADRAGDFGDGFAPHAHRHQ